MQKKNNLKINYLCSSPENISVKKKFDVILNMEIVEHVEDLDLFLKKSSLLLKKNGIMFIATINKTLKSYIFAIVGAEYILKWFNNLRDLLVSSHKIISDFFNTSRALNVISLRLPMGVDTIYKPGLRSFIIIND